MLQYGEHNERNVTQYISILLELLLIMLPYFNAIPFSSLVCYQVFQQSFTSSSKRVLIDKIDYHRSLASI